MNRQDAVIRWIGLALGAIGSLSGLIISSWFLSASSKGGGDPIADFSEAELKVYGVVMLVLFCASLVATFLSAKAPRAFGLALIVTGGLILILAVYGIIAWLFGGLVVLPFGFLIMVAGFLALVHAGTTGIRVGDTRWS